jgi:hypothetical protein
MRRRSRRRTKKDEEEGQNEDGKAANHTYNITSTGEEACGKGRRRMRRRII